MDLAISARAEQFRSDFRQWLDRALPQEWRERRLGVDVVESEYSEIQRAWGRRLFEGGYGAPTWPREFGGMGLGVDEQIAHVEELASIGAPDPTNGNAIDNFGPTVLRFGTPDQQRRFLLPMLAHDILWCQGFSEPGAGSDLASLVTRAVPDGNERLRIYGQKTWTSLAHRADWCYMLVRTDPDAPKHAGLSMVAVSMDQPQIDVRPIRQITGNAEFCEVFLDGAGASMSDVIGMLGQGWEIATYTLRHERTARMAVRSIRLSKDFEALRMLCQQAVVSTGLQPALQEELVDGFVRTLVLRSVVKRNLAFASAGADFGAYAAMGKLSWSEWAQDQAHVALDLLGPSIIEHANRSRLIDLLNVRAASIYGGTSQIQRNIIARSAGLESSRGGA